MSDQHKIIKRLKNFTPPKNGDWKEFIHLMDALWLTSNPKTAYQTLFEFLVKYDSNYMECQWDIIHGMERFGDYESELLSSLLNKPVDMTVTMLSRMINSGIGKIENKSIGVLLDEILAREDISEELKEFAQDCKTRFNRLPI